VAPRWSATSSSSDELVRGIPPIVDLFSGPVAT
jgi:hypothetical protein